MIPIANKLCLAGGVFFWWVASGEGKPGTPRFVLLDVLDATLVFEMRSDHLYMYITMFILIFTIYTCSSIHIHCILYTCARYGLSCLYLCCYAVPICSMLASRLPNVRWYFSSWRDLSLMILTTCIMSLSSCAFNCTFMHGKIDKHDDHWRSSDSWINVVG